MFAKIIGPSEFRVNGSRKEELTLLHSYLQMLNDKMLKTNNDTCLKYKYHLKQMTISKEKNATSFETLNSTFYAK